MEEQFVVVATELTPLVLLLTGLIFTATVDPYISAKHRGVMLVIVILAATLIVQNLWENALAVGLPNTMLRTILAIYGYSVRPVFLVLFLYLVHPGHHYAASWILVGVNCVIHMTALFSSLCFTITPDNHYYPGPLGNTCLVISILLLVNLLFLSIRHFRAGGKQEKLIPIFIVVMILVSIYMDGEVGFAEQPITFLTIAIVVGSMFCYIWLHLRFVREHEEDLKAQQRIQIMLSQIQPHFLYNSLSAIQSVCQTDPMRAREAIAQFAEYLRHNMDSLSDDRAIPFEKELEHVKRYVELQQLRFGKELNVTYDLEAKDFLLPTLTLQPIVENAVTYGVRKQDDHPGLIAVSSREYPDRYEITVRDNGPGFVPDTLPGDSERSHIGLRNVRERLQYRVGGILRIDSVMGEGTTVTIILPKEEEGS